MNPSLWDVRLSAQSQKDVARILRDTARDFGPRQASIYKEILLDALDELHDGPNVPGSIAHDEIRAGLRFLHIARKGRRGRHFIVYRLAGDCVIRVLRILHDAMDTARHI